MHKTGRYDVQEIAATSTYHLISKFRELPTQSKNSDHGVSTVIGGVLCRSFSAADGTSLFEAAAQCLFDGNASVLPRGEHPGDEIGAEAQDRKQE